MRVCIAINISGNDDVLLQDDYHNNRTLKCQDYFVDTNYQILYASLQYNVFESFMFKQ